MERLLWVLVLAGGCSGLPPECEALRTCCASFAAAAEAQCEEALDRGAGDGRAGLVCQQALDAYRTAGLCMDGVDVETTPASCGELDGCCQQMSGPSRVDCIATAGQIEQRPDAAKACRDATSALTEGGFCVVAGLPGAEDNDITCRDGVDNDGNGHTDCADWSCSRNPDVTVCTGEIDDTTCSNGIDDDGNGHTDCADWSCSMNPNVTVCTEGSYETCHDGIDNDGDSYVDCDDFDCRGAGGC